MSAKLGTLTLDLIAKVGGFTGPIEKARRDVKKSLKGVRDDINAGAKAFGALAVASTAASAAILASSAANARELRNLADIANTGVEDFQRFAFAAETVGIEQDKLSDILKDVTDRVGDFVQTGGGPLADFFENIAPKIGVTADQFRNLSGRDALQLYVESLQRANLSQEEMTFYLEAVASDATALIPLLRDNGIELDRLSEKAENLGLVLSQTEVDQLSGLGDDFSIATKALEVFTSKVGAQLAPIVSAVSDEFFNAAEGAFDMDEAVLEAYESIVGGAQFVLNAISGIDRAFRLVANGGLAIFSGQLALIAGGVAGIFDVLNAASVLPIKIADDSISALRKFRDEQLRVFEFAGDEIETLLESQLAGDQFAQFIRERQLDAASVRDRILEEAISGFTLDMLGEGFDELATESDKAAASQAKLAAVAEQLQETLSDVTKSKAWKDIFGAESTDARAADFDTYAKLVADDIKNNSQFAESNLETLKQILQTSIDNGNQGLSNNGIIEQLDIEGMSQVIQGLEEIFKTTRQNNLFTQGQSDAKGIEDVAADTFRTASAAEKLVQIAEQKPEPVGTLNLNIAGPNGQQLETQIQANTSTLQNLQDFINQFTNNQARAAAGG